MRTVHRPCIAAAAACLLLLPLPVSAVPEEGTEQFPELADPSGDVRYGPAHTGGPSKHIDLLAVWIEHDPSNDSITLTLKVEDAGALVSGNQDKAISCSGVGNSTRDGRLSGNFRFSWSKPLQSSQIHGAWTWQEQTTNPTGSGPSSGRPVEHDFRSRLTNPGLFFWTAQRNSLLAFAESIRALDVTCYEFPRAAGVVPLGENTDGGKSNAEYSFKELRRTRAPDGSEEPWANVTETAEPTPSDAPDSSSTPGLGVMSAGLALLALVVSLRRYR